MKTTLSRIITSDHLELVGLLYEPEVSTDKVLVHVHGMAGNFYENLFLDDMAKALIASGVALFVFNNRGCEYMKDIHKVENGKRYLVRIGNAYEVFEDSAMDIKAAVDFVSSKSYSKIHLSGHSLGSPKVAYYVAEVGDSRLSSVIFLSPSDMVGLFKIEKNYERDLALSKMMIGEGKGGELLPYPVLWDGTYLSARTFVSLGDSSSPVAIFNFHNQSDRLPVLSKITIPTLTIMGRKDDALVVPIEETMSRIKTALSLSSNVETNILGDADHGYSKHGRELAEAIKGWIMKQ